MALRPFTPIVTKRANGTHDAKVVLNRSQWAIARGNQGAQTGRPARSARSSHTSRHQGSVTTSRTVSPSPLTVTSTVVWPPRRTVTEKSPTELTWATSVPTVTR